MNIFIGNLSFDTTEQKLNEIFAPFGEVRSVKIVSDQYTRRSRGFAFVEMADDTAANNAISQLNDTSVDGRMILVNEARPKTESQGDRFFDKKPKRNNY